MEQNYRDNPFEAHPSYPPTQQLNNSSYNQPGSPSAFNAPSSPYAHQPLATQSNHDLNTNAQPWMELEPEKKSSKKWWFIFGGIGLVVVIIVAVVAAVAVKNNNKKSSGSSSSSVSGTNSNPSDPSSFTKDNRLHQSFYGMAYTPEGSQLPNCGNKLEDVITDIQLLSQLTTRIRLYGADCNQSAIVLEAIKQTKVNMTVWLANYAIATDNNAAYDRQRDLIKSAIQTYGTDHIGGITVGNEFMLNYLNANGATDPNSAVGNTGAALLIADIEDTRSMLASLSLSKTIPVGTSDAGSYFNTKVLEAVDYGMANVHPWFANQDINDAAGWTASFFESTDVQAANALSNKPQMYIAETGWPTKSSNASGASDGVSLASEANLQIFLNTFVCQANANNTGYFYFEYFDEPWKDAEFGGVEGWWGLFNSNRTLKNINIPTC